MKKSIRIKYIERKHLIGLSGEAFIDSRQHINPHDLVYCELYYLPILRAQFRDDKKTARITIEVTNGFKGAVDIPIEEFNNLPVIEIIIEYDEQHTADANA